MAEDRVYVVAHDIAHRTRWRRLFRLMQGYGVWLQLFVFQCRLTTHWRADFAARLDTETHHDEDHVVILDLGPARKVDLRVESLGKSYAAPARRAIVV